ncbi:GntR family transcriptional regulator [Pseudonocardia sp. H11422]|uniref:GntR family transcriptional regulator n=1 Tax=Pseudonocardia sp. H11422 TaxID=2835866 RepID=UPI001BDC4B71|nr:GntR family transcriptional regulator [Pseudonocardia sp. H11422]
MARAAAVAYNAMRDGIAAGLYPAGTWLREEDIALSTGVSRTPVREALRRLQAEGFVEIQPNRGAMVVGWGAEELDDIYDLRVMLEGYAARRAARRGALDAAGFARLGALCTEMERLLDEQGEQHCQRLTQLNLAFHAAVHQAARNRQLLLNILPVLIQGPLVRETFHHYTREELARSFAQHRDILEALVAGDGDWAESTMRAHIRAARVSLRRTDLRRDATAVPGPAGDS